MLFFKCEIVPTSARHMARPSQLNHSLDRLDIPVAGCTLAGRQGVLNDNFIRKVRPSRQATHMKMVHGQLPLGERRYQQATVQDESQKQCPCCCAETELMRHFLRCDHNSCKKTSLQTLGAEICNLDHHPCRYLLTEGLKHWYGSTGDCFNLLSPPILRI